MEIQYSQGLNSLNETLPEITSDLVFQSKQLMFRPALEELKAKYYKEMKLFVSIPYSFQGVGGSPEIYRNMTDSNAKSLIALFQNAEKLFQKLKELEQSYAP